MSTGVSHGGDLATRLREELAGRAIGPADNEYDEARTVFYTGWGARPAAIARPANERDVAAVVRIARESGVDLAIRSGGHSVAGHSLSDGIVLDLSAMRSLEIDVDGRTAWAGAGLTAGEYTRAVGQHGLATGFGDSPTVGVGGITLGGGIGYLHRLLGMTIDSLLAAEVVTAEGEVLQADEKTNPDLFWALRGGGGNFGVATRFRFRLHPVDEVVAGMMMLPASPPLVAEFLGLALNAPDELSGLINVTFAPPMPFIPQEHHGKPIIMAVLAYAGTRSAAERALSPFRALAPPLVDVMRPTRYGQIYEGGPEPPTAPAASVRSVFMDGFETRDAETVFEHLGRSTARMRVAQFRVLGGAVARVPADATAFAHRDRGMMAMAAALFEDTAERAVHDAWANELAGALQQGAAGAYIGFLGNDGESAVRAAYPGPTLERLRSIKSRYDPTNVFRLNQNIRPAAVGPG